MRDNVAEGRNDLLDVESRDGTRKTIILREKADWPLIYNAPIAGVQNWLFERYGMLCNLAFGRM